MHEPTHTSDQLLFIDSVKRVVLDWDISNLFYYLNEDFVSRFSFRRGISSVTFSSGAVRC